MQKPHCENINAAAILSSFYRKTLPEERALSPRPEPELLLLPFAFHLFDLRSQLPEL